MMNWLKKRFKINPSHKRLVLSHLMSCRLNFAPFILGGILVVYLLMGSAAFMFFEHSHHEKTLSKFQFNLLLNRQQFARQISSVIFNNTKDMLVIVDRFHSKRIHENLMRSLKEFEQKVFSMSSAHNERNNLLLSTNDYRNEEWTIGNSFNYALSLLTTIGNGNRSPKTFSGQLFTTLYCLLGVPFYGLTLIVIAFRIFDFARNIYGLSQHRLTLLIASIGLYAVWLMIFSLILFSNSVPKSGWRAAYTAILSSLTIQTPNYNNMSEGEKLLMLLSITISLLLGCITVLFLTGLYHRRKTDIKAQRHQKSVLKFGSAGAASFNNKVAAEKCSEVSNNQKMSPIVTMRVPEQQQFPVPQTRFQVIVDEVGTTTLKKAQSPSSISPKMIDDVDLRRST